MPISEDVVRYQFFKKLTELPYIDEIWLYGSRARKDHQDRSDIDLAILCPRACQDDWYAVLRIIQEPDTLLKVDCVRFDTLDGNSQFAKNILKDHILLYSRKGL